MTAIEDPATQLGRETAGPDQPNDELEHWLSNLRTEVAADPSGWIDEDPAAEHAAGQAVQRGPRPPRQHETDVAEQSNAGRHRAPE